MRKFQVGDRVRWYANIEGDPVWNFHIASFGAGRWEEGFVSRVHEDTDEFCVDGDWEWPQPGHTKACYGEPGYLELVEVAPEYRFQVHSHSCGRLFVWNALGITRSCFPEACRPELESICAKLNKKEGTP